MILLCSCSDACPPTNRAYQYPYSLSLVLKKCILFFPPLGRSTSPEVEMQANSRSPQSRVTTSPVSSYNAAHGSHEHYERIECTYIGSCEVSLGMGMEVLNEAVDKLSTVSHRWLDVNVDVATSNIKISDTSVSYIDMI